MHVTIVDDLPENLDFYKEILSVHFDLKLFQDPKKLSAFLESGETDLIMLDLHMPEMNGLELYKSLKRSYQNIPVIFVSGDNAEDNIIKALNDGADDFIVKPVSNNELVARIKNKIQNYKKFKKDNSVIKIQNFTLYCDLQQAEIEGRKVQLTPIEYKIINLLGKTPNKIFSREFITNMIWPDIHVQNQNIDTHLSNLRKKLKPFSDHIKTIKSRGYILRI